MVQRLVLGIFHCVFEMDKADFNADIWQITALVELVLGGLTELGFYLCERHVIADPGFAHRQVHPARVGVAR